jgi:calcium/proton exchanger cax
MFFFFSAAIWALATLCVATALIGVCSDALTSSISAVTDTGNISQDFVGLILIPIIGNAAEHATAVTVACKDKMDLSIGVAVGSSLQISLGVLPLVVTIGWMADRPLSLDFDGYQITILFVAVLLGIARITPTYYAPEAYSCSQLLDWGRQESLVRRGDAHDTLHPYW